MNLVKNGAVLLAALSVLAMTSCNKGDAKKEVDYDAALAWVKEHYKNTEELDRPTQLKVKWDYTRNKVKDKFPEGLWKDYKDLENKDGNGLTQYALTEEYYVKDPSKSTGTETVDVPPKNMGIRLFYVPMNETKFIEDYGDFKDDENVKFYIVNNKTLTVTGSEETDYIGVIEYTMTETRVFNEEGYLDHFDDRLYGDDIIGKAKDSQGKDVTVDLGKMDIRVTASHAE